MMRGRLAYIVICAGLASACSDNPSDAQSDTTDPKTTVAKAGTGPAETTTAPAFTQAAAVGDLYEVESSRLALMKAGSPAVRQFAEMMIADHTATTEQLKQMPSAGMLPMEPDARRQNMLNELRSLDGVEFDRRYIAQQTEAHREAVMLMEGYAERGDEERLRQFAASTAPKIRMHLEMVEQLGRP